MLGYSALSMTKLSMYADSLPPDATARYLDEIESIGGPDSRSSLTSLETSRMLYLDQLVHVI